jgi:hypothetical protein
VQFRPSPTSFQLPAQALENLHTVAETMEVSVSAAVIQCARSLRIVIHAGWRPKHLPPAGPAILPVRILGKEKGDFLLAAKEAGLSHSDFFRVAAFAALHALRGKSQVSWPLHLKKADFEKALKALAERGE